MEPTSGTRSNTTKEAFKSNTWTKRCRHGSHSGPCAGPAAAELVRGPAWCTGCNGRGEDEVKGDLEGPRAGGPDRQAFPGSRPPLRHRQGGGIHLCCGLPGELQQPDFGPLRRRLADQDRNLLSGGLPQSLEGGQLPRAAAQSVAEEEYLQSHRVPRGSDEGEGVPQAAGGKSGSSGEMLENGPVFGSHGWFSPLRFGGFPATSSSVMPSVYYLTLVNFMQLMHLFIYS